MCTVSIMEKILLFILLSIQVNWTIAQDSLQIVQWNRDSSVVYVIDSAIMTSGMKWSTDEASSFLSLEEDWAQIRV